MKPRFKVGAWRIDITPPLGSYICCGFEDKPAEEILDPVYARAIVIEDGSNEFAIVNADTCAVPDHIYHEIAGVIEVKCSIPSKNVILAATHTDKGPLLGKILDSTTKIDLHNIEKFKKDVVTAVYMAKMKKQPVRLAIGRGEDNELVFNRRLKKPDGSVVMNFADPEYLKDCLDNAAVDREITAVRFDGEDGNPLAIIINYSNHNNAAGSLPVITPDYMGHTEKVLRKVYGSDLTALFLPGACGDVNWINHKRTDKSLSTDRITEFGQIIAEIVIKALAAAEYKDISCINAVSRTITIKDRSFREIDTREDDSFGPGKKGGIEFQTFKNEKMQATGKELAYNEITLSALRLGDDIAIMTNPGELFVDLGLEIKKKSPFKYTMISELTNGYAGYICTKEAYDEGGYEARRTSSSSHLETDAGERVVSASLELLWGLC